jgi:hypothetical protein
MKAAAFEDHKHVVVSYQVVELHNERADLFVIFKMRKGWFRKKYRGHLRTCRTYKEAIDTMKDHIKMVQGNSPKYASWFNRHGEPEVSSILCGV